MSSSGARMLVRLLKTVCKPSYQNLLIEVEVWRCATISATAKLTIQQRLEGGYNLNSWALFIYVFFHTTTRMGKKKQKQHYWCLSGQTVQLLLCLVFLHPIWLEMFWTAISTPAPQHDAALLYPKGWSQIVSCQYYSWQASHISCTIWALHVIKPQNALTLWLGAVTYRSWSIQDSRHIKRIKVAM